MCRASQHANVDIVVMFVVSDALVCNRYSLLMGGFIVPRRGIPSGMRWALYTSWFNYGFEALCINEFTDKPWGHDILVDLVYISDTSLHCIITHATMMI